jgi:hypothetical protein
LVVKHEGRVRKRFAFPVHEKLIAPLSRLHKLSFPSNFAFQR